MGEIQRRNDGGNCETSKEFGDLCVVITIYPCVRNVVLGIYFLTSILNEGLLSIVHTLCEQKMRSCFWRGPSPQVARYVLMGTGLSLTTAQTRRQMNLNERALMKGESVVLSL
jgi:hypothetical protein